MEARAALWVEPLGDLTAPPGVLYLSARAFHAYDRFAQALGEAMGCPVEVIERPPEEATGAGLFLLHFGLPLAYALARRRGALPGRVRRWGGVNESDRLSSRAGARGGTPRRRRRAQPDTATGLTSASASTAA